MVEQFIHLITSYIATTEENQPQVLKLGTGYKLLQDGNKRFVASKRTAS